MKIKTNGLIGPALDWAVAKCMWPDDIGNTVPFHRDGSDYSPSTNWAQGGPIIEREGMQVQPFKYRNIWIAYIDKPYTHGDGPTPLIAAMRCYVASKLGDTVEVPEGLV